MMKKINVELEVPSYDCVLCKYFDVRRLECIIFGVRLKMAKSDSCFMIERCYMCKNSEVII